VRKHDPEKSRQWCREWRERNLTLRRKRERERTGVPHVIPGVDERCAICGIREDRSSPLVIDHNHSTGQFRGWLCGPCNRGIGFLRDNPDNLRSAADYVEAA
jgi:hypothetical protein